MRLDDQTWYDALGLTLTPDRLLQTPRWLSASEAGRFVINSGLAHRIVWSVAQDATTKGWTVSTGDTELTERPFADIVTEAIGSARALGGAWLWPVLRGESMDSWNKPLAEGPHEIAAIHVLCRDEVTPFTWVTNAESEDWGRPAIVRVTPVRDGMTWPSQFVHSSRLAYAPGLRAWPSQRVKHMGYDLSALDLYRAAIESMEAAWNSTSLMLDRRALMWIRLAGIDDASTVEDDAIAGDLRGRMDAIVARMKGQDPVMWLGEGDDTGWSSPSLAGTSESVAALVSRLCAVEGASASRLMGTPPQGLSSDDAAGARSDAALVGRTRGAVEPAILKLYAIARGPDKDRVIEWAPTDDQTPRELAEISTMYANRDATLVAAGILDPSESRSRFGDAVESPTPTLDDAVLDEPDLMGVLDEPEPTEEVVE